ncbi:MAG: polymer-forming cytoskeletal protein [Pyrinomonadaceae bacterium]
MFEVDRRRDSKTGQNGTAAARVKFRDSPAEARPTPTEIRLNPQPSPVSRKNSVPAQVPQVSINTYRTRTPVITGEVNYKGVLKVEGIVTGQLGGSGGSLAVRQKCGAGTANGPELSGEISFRDLVRVNGHIAGTVYSQRGTLIIDDSARVDGNVEVGVAVINGTINGDIVAHQRVEVGPSAKIYGHIWTRSIAIKDGALFEGLCNMIED